MSQFLSDLEPLPQISNIKIGQHLGQGGFAVVRLGELLDAMHKQIVAVKYIHRRYAHSLGVSDQRIGHEIRIHKECSGHPNIIELYLYGTDNVWAYMVMELAGGGDLFDKIDPDVGLKPEIANFYFRQLINAVDFIHMKGVAHRDIKPENIFIDDCGNLKLGDFGFATVYRRHNSEKVILSHERCGSAPYMAPEIIVEGGEGKCGYEPTGVDIWACGIVLFVLLTGQIPWEAPLYSRDFNFTRYADIMAEGLQIPDDPWTRLSPEVLGLIRGIIKPDYNERLSMKRIRAHTWMNVDNSFMDKKGMCSDSQNLAEELYSHLHVSTSDDDLLFAISLVASIPSNERSDSLPDLVSSSDYALIESSLASVSHLMLDLQAVDSIPHMSRPLRQAESSFGSMTQQSQSYQRHQASSNAAPIGQANIPAPAMAPPASRVAAPRHRSRVALPSVPSHSQPVDNKAVLIDDFSSDLVFASQNPIADVAKLPSYNMQDDHERILAIVSKDPAVLQFRKSKKLTSKTKYMFSLKSMTRFFSTVPLESLVHMLLDALHRLGVSVDSMEDLRSEDMANRTELYIAVAITGEAFKLPVKGYVHITRTDPATNLKEVDFVKLKGDPLEWRNFFKKVTLLCRDALYVDNEI